MSDSEESVSTSLARDHSDDKNLQPVLGSHIGARDLLANLGCSPIADQVNESFGRADRRLVAWRERDGESQLQLLKRFSGNAKS
jgi:hypothetical protein